jgi:hypothetical protein
VQRSLTTLTRPTAEAEARSWPGRRFGTARPPGHLSPRGKKESSQQSAFLHGIVVFSSNVRDSFQVDRPSATFLVYASDNRGHRPVAGDPTKAVITLLFSKARNRNSDWARMNTRRSLISRVSVHRTIPTRIPSYDFRASGEAATTVQDVVEKQVFADCPDRGATAAVGGFRSFADTRANGKVAPKAPVSDPNRLLPRVQTFGSLGPRTNQPLCIPLGCGRTARALA